MCTTSRDSLPKRDEMKGIRVALFGSSANPPTLGHHKIVEYITKQRNDLFDEIWVLPVYHHIFKSKRKLESYNDRVVMCKPSFEPLSTTKCQVRVLPVEENVFESNETFRTGTARCGTIDILLYLKALYKDVQFTLILGTDTYNDLIARKWKRSEEIMSMVGVLVVARPGCVRGEHHHHHHHTPNTLEATSTQTQTHTHTHSVIYVEIPDIPDISSTTVSSRDPYQGGSETFFAQALHPAVWDYIRTHRLYGYSPEATVRRHKHLVVCCVCTLAFATIAARFLRQQQLQVEVGSLNKTEA
eukprot:gene3542-7047_t